MFGLCSTLLNLGVQNLQEHILALLRTRLDAGDAALVHKRVPHEKSHRTMFRGVFVDMSTTIGIETLFFPFLVFEKPQRS